MDEIIVRYVTTAGLEREDRIRTDETSINLDLRDMVSIDLLPLIWCSRLESLTLRHNKLTEVDLSPLSKCRRLRSLSLSHNLLKDIDLNPLSECPDLEDVDIEHNEHLKKVNLSPLFECPKLLELRLDPTVVVTADIFLRSVGSWPEVLLERYHRILWTYDGKPR